ncbi:unnamed protein product [Peronospora belbahrii]|uniref:Myosin-binding domain-containing protein n=1 Tax=Peronospora belbahrii TaxID=622444 RepID=A0ABN8CZB1_9STRA|nr:unnamed protein product [Peronospora belbahrii]
MATKHLRRDQNGQMSNGYNWFQVLQVIQRCIEVVAVRRLLQEIDTFHPTIREDLQLTMEIDPAVLIRPSKCWWKRYLLVIEILRSVHVLATTYIWKTIATTAGVVVVAMEAMVITERGMEEVDLLHMLGWIVRVTAFVLLGLELAVRLLLSLYKWRSRRLIGSLRAFIATLEAYDKVFAGSLMLIKRAELASRGYRLDTGLLPPIGRLETTSNAGNGGDGASVKSTATTAVQNQLRCLPLRRKLRAVNEQLQIRASILLKEGEYTRHIKIQDSVEEETTVSEQAPSLLLTALTKQHNQSTLLLENAVHSVLVQKLAHACSYRGNVRDWSLFRMLGSYRLTVEHLVKELRTWMDDLEVWNSTRDPMVLLACARNTKSSDYHEEKKHVSFSTEKGVCLKGVASQLHELRSASETLTALIVAAQYELLSADSAVERLANLHDVMHSKIDQLHDAWSSYGNALSALTGREDISEGANGDVPSENEVQRNSEPIAALEYPSFAVSEDPDCTVVFTGTSTGDEGFDLQALLKQQERDASATLSGPTPRFIRELQDVLAHRQAHAYSELTKQVDHDQPVNQAAASPRLPAANAMFALPGVPRSRQPPSVSPRVDAQLEATAGAFNLELQSLLQRSQRLQPDVIEFRSDRGEHAVIDAECGELVAPSSRSQEQH